MPVKKTQSEFNIIHENDLANYKVSLLEKHLIESREAVTELKEQELELHEKQLQIIVEMQRINEANKQIDDRLIGEIQSAVEHIKTDMFTEWQESVKTAMVANSKALTEDKLAEYEVLYKRQNDTIEKQTNQIKSMINGYKMMKYICYAVIAVAAIVFALVPLGQFSYDAIRDYLVEPSWWGGVILLSAIILMVLVISFTVFISKNFGRGKKEQ